MDVGDRDAVHKKGFVLSWVNFSQNLCLWTQLNILTLEGKRLLHSHGPLCRFVRIEMPSEIFSLVPSFSSEDTEARSKAGSCAMPASELAAM